MAGNWEPWLEGWNLELKYLNASCKGSRRIWETGPNISHHFRNHEGVLGGSVNLKVKLPWPMLRDLLYEQGWIGRTLLGYYGAKRFFDNIGVIALGGGAAKAEL
nr:hypothetical protein CFP56_54119 [Quercus suber]